MAFRLHSSVHIPIPDGDGDALTNPSNETGIMLLKTGMLDRIDRRLLMHDGIDVKVTFKYSNYNNCSQSGNKNEYGQDWKLFPNGISEILKKRKANFLKIIFLFLRFTRHSSLVTLVTGREIFGKCAARRIVQLM
jgi:hypothetical protein